MALIDILLTVVQSGAVVNVYGDWLKEPEARDLQGLYTSAQNQIGKTSPHPQEVGTTRMSLQALGKFTDLAAG